MERSREEKIGLVREIVKKDGDLLASLAANSNMREKRPFAIKSDAGFWSVNNDWTNDPDLIYWMEREPFYMPKGVNVHFVPKN